VPGADDDQDPGGQQMMSLGVQQLATAMAANGGLGIGKMIAKAMHENAEKANASAAAAPKAGVMQPESVDTNGIRAKSTGLD
jgi:Rod binding domain-containing protein